ncbi:MAG TPA: hypothetical protein VGL86_23420 [Polyangia bacterium]|jgi:hypothetical protein
MNVEDSYEGAVRRLARLGHAGIHLAPPSADRVGDADRLRDLEELATLACDDNERLTRELDAARVEMDRLRLQVMSLQSMVAGNAQAPAAEPDYAPRRGRSGGFYFFVIAILGAGAAALFTFRPWDRLQPSLAMASVTTPPVASAPVVPTPTPAATATPSAPVVATPAVAATAPSTTAVVPKVAPSIPKVAAPAPRTVMPTVARTSAPSHHRAAKHHAAKKHESKHKASSKPAIGDTDDPLGGTSL